MMSLLLCWLVVPLDEPMPKKESAEQAIRKVLDDQTRAWNRGDIEGFMVGYWKSPELTFTSVGEARIGSLLTCSCAQHLKVPSVSGRSAKYRTWGDLGIELLVYGTGGGLLGFGLGLLIVSQLYRGIQRSWLIIVGLTLAGFL